MEKNADKFALFKKIQENKAVLFGNHSNSITQKTKEETWQSIRSDLIAEGHRNFEEKSWKQLRDVTWATTKRRAIAKIDENKKTGSGGVPLNEV